MEILIFCLAAFGASLLTFFSGFGLGTLLTPVFIFSFPVPVAITLTAMVHLANNVFKLILVGRKASIQVLINFGIPAIFMAFAGSMLLMNLPDDHYAYTYSIGETLYGATTTAIIMASILILLVVLEYIPKFKKLAFHKNKIALGGALSGFFGGLTGNQGALRTAFLIHAGLTKETFIGTTVVISTFIDVTRLGVYSGSIEWHELSTHKTIVFASIISAMAGSFIGNKLLKKITIQFLHHTIAVFIGAFAIALLLGFIGA